MTAVVEYGDGTRRFREGTFPDRWGPPPASEEMRTRWILSHIAQDTRAAPVRGANRARQEQLEARRTGPTLTGLQARARLLERRRYDPYHVRLTGPEAYRELARRIAAAA